MPAARETILEGKKCPPQAEKKLGSYSTVLGFTRRFFRKITLLDGFRTRRFFGGVSYTVQKVSEVGVRPSLSKSKKK